MRDNTSSLCSSLRPGVQNLIVNISQIMVSTGLKSES